jgi:uncharacterized membrane protein YGL010W
MRNLTEQLSNYAKYHRDRRNIATHFVGIPMIVLAVVALLARVPAVAAVAAAGGAIFYLVLDRPFGVAMTALLGAAVWAGIGLGALPLVQWLGAALGLFIIGWIIQFVGHAFEGRKPAFVDDLLSFMIGPLFVTVEAAFMLGLRKQLEAEIVARAGPTRAGRPTGAASQT